MSRSSLDRSGYSDTNSIVSPIIRQPWPNRPDSERSLSIGSMFTAMSRVSSDLPSEPIEEPSETHHSDTSNPNFDILRSSGSPVSLSPQSSLSDHSSGVTIYSDVSEIQTRGIPRSAPFIRDSILSSLSSNSQGLVNTGLLSQANISSNVDLDEESRLAAAGREREIGLGIGTTRTGMNAIDGTGVLALSSSNLFSPSTPSRQGMHTKEPPALYERDTNRLSPQIPPPSRSGHLKPPSEKSNRKFNASPAQSLMGSRHSGATAATPVTSPVTTPATTPGSTPVTTPAKNARATATTTRTTVAAQAATPVRIVASTPTAPVARTPTASPTGTPAAYPGGAAESGSATPAAMSTATPTTTPLASRTETLTAPRSSVKKRPKYSQIRRVGTALAGRAPPIRSGLPRLPNFPSFSDGSPFERNFTSDASNKFDSYGRKETSVRNALLLVGACGMFPPLWMFVGAGYFDTLMGVIPRWAKVVSLMLATLTFAAGSALVIVFSIVHV